MVYLLIAWWIFPWQTVKIPEGCTNSIHEIDFTKMMAWTILYLYCWQKLVITFHQIPVIFPFPCVSLFNFLLLPSIYGDMTSLLSPLIQQDRNWLVVLTILKNMSSSMGRIIPYIMEHQSIHVWNHQPDKIRIWVFLRFFGDPTIGVFIEQYQLHGWFSGGETPITRPSVCSHKNW